MLATNQLFYPYSFILLVMQCFYPFLLWLRRSVVCLAWMWRSLTSAQKSSDQIAPHPLPHQAKTRSLSGIALLITLSVMTFVLFLVGNNLEKTSTEIMLQQNELTDYQLERSKFAVIRLVINALQLFGPNLMHYVLDGNLTTPQEVLFLDASGSDLGLSLLSVRSLDHYFYINRTNFGFENETSLAQIQIFKNVLTSFVHPDNSQFNPAEFNRFIGSLNDWLDFDQQITNENFLYGQENYPEEDLLKVPKNTLFDDLSELRSLRAFQDLHLLTPQQSVYDLPVRVLRENRLQFCDIGPLNLNMLPKNSDERAALLDKYVGWSSQINLTACGYEELFQNQTRLIQLINDFLVQQGPAPFSIPLKNDANWNQIMDQMGVKDIKTKLDGFFSARSELIEVRFRISAGSLQRDILVQLLLDYSDAKSDIPSYISVENLVEDYRSFYEHQTPETL